MSGPAWLGIGVQRAGTTWFTDLLTQHPGVELAEPGRKELHYLYRGLPGSYPMEPYLRRFDRDDDIRRGEFTPAYMRCLWVPHIVDEVLALGAPVIVLLRDPVERFASAIRNSVARRNFTNHMMVRRLGSEAQWSGMYAAQLDIWSTVVGNRMMVFQYEKVIRSPQSAVDMVWQRLGLDPVPLTDVARPSRTSTDGGEWEWPEGLQATLKSLYKQDVSRLDRWDIDRSLWPNFC